MRFPSMCWHDSLTTDLQQIGTINDPTGCRAQDCARYVRLWHKADMQTALMNVRFEGNNGHDADVDACPLMTHSGHRQGFASGQYQLAFESAGGHQLAFLSFSKREALRRDSGPEAARYLRKPLRDDLCRCRRSQGSWHCRRIGV